MVPQLTSGVIWAWMNGEQAPPEPYIQILSLKKMGGEGNRDIFHLDISDGEFSHSAEMLATQLNKQIYEGKMESFAVVKVKTMNMAMDNSMNSKKRVILWELEVVGKGSEVGMKIGNPVAWVDGMCRPQEVVKSAISSGSSGARPKGFNSSDCPSATKKPKIQNMNLVPTGAVVPIRDLDPYMNPVTIRARVTKKEDVKTWSNKRGSGKRFSIDILDDTGEIRMTGFNSAVDVFFDMIQVNHVYYMSKFTMKPANKQYTRIKHELELTFKDDTQVIRCVGDTSDVPLVAYKFVTIPQIKHVEVDKTIDVIGVCKSVGRLKNIKSKETGEKIKKRELVLTDPSYGEITLSLWGKTAQDFRDKTMPIVAVKGAKVLDFDGKYLSCLRSSTFQVNPDLNQAHAL